MKGFLLGIIALSSLMMLITGSLAADEAVSKEQASQEICKKICQGVIDGLKKVTDSEEKVNITDCHSDISGGEKHSFKLECEVTDEKQSKEKVTLVIENIN